MGRGHTVLNPSGIGVNFGVQGALQSHRAFTILSRQTPGRDLRLNVAFNLLGHQGCIVTTHNGAVIHVGATKALKVRDETF